MAIPFASAADLREAEHVLFVNRHFFASFNDFHHCYTKQYAFGLQVFGLAFSNIYYSPDFLFLSHGRTHCGGFDFTKTGEEILS